MASKSVQAKLSALDASIDELENFLDPLFAQSLPETLLGLETIQQAKLQTLLPYLLYDLVFIYLKTRGIDPRTHPVVSELERVKQYFDKIAKAEKEPQSRPSTVDKAAAGRFIKHAIAQAKTVMSSPQDPPAPSEPSIRVPVKVTSKMIARAKYEKEVQEADDVPSDNEDDGGLEVFDEINGNEVGDEADSEDVPSPSLKSKGKQKVKDSVSEPLAGSKRRRVAIDPFTGERIPPPTQAPDSESVLPTQAQLPQPKKKSKKRKTSPNSSPGAATPAAPQDVAMTSTPEVEDASLKKTKKKKNKTKKDKLVE